MPLVSAIRRAPIVGAVGKRRCQVARFTSLERRIDDVAGRLLENAPSHGFRAALVEFLVFGLKQAWACIFGALMLVMILAARLWYPDDALLAVASAAAVQAFAWRTGDLAREACTRAPESLPADVWRLYLGDAAARACRTISSSVTAGHSA